MMSLNTISQDHQIDLKLANNYTVVSLWVETINFEQKADNL